MPLDLRLSSVSFSKTETLEAIFYSFDTFESIF